MQIRFHTAQAWRRRSWRVAAPIRGTSPSANGRRSLRIDGGPNGDPLLVINSMAAGQQNNPDAPVKVLGKVGWSLGFMIRDFLHRSDIPFEWIEFRNDEEARTVAGVDGLHDPPLPVCIFPESARMEHPTRARRVRVARRNSLMRCRIEGSPTVSTRWTPCAFSRSANLRWIP